MNLLPENVEIKDGLKIIFKAVTWFILTLVLACLVLYILYPWKLLSYVSLLIIIVIVILIGIFFVILSLMKSVGKVKRNRDR